MLELTRRALRLRRREQALGDGSMTWISEEDDPCLVLRRPAGDADPHVLVALNLGSQPALVLADEVLLSSGADPVPAEDGFWLAPDTGAWLR
jgi:alpha-glucosidase